MLLWDAHDIFDPAVQDKTEVWNGIDVQISSFPQLGQRPGIDIELIDELVLCDPFALKQLPERWVVHIVTL